MKNTYLIAIATLFLLHGTSCDIINPEEEIPAYIHIDNFELTTSVGEGSNSSNITEAFVFVDNGFIGAYSLPATFPILSSGNQRVDIFPGIKDNGIDATPEIYPFYTSVQTNLDLVATETDSIFPKIEYVEEINVINETFESSLQILRDDIDGDSVTTVVLTDSEVFEGAQSAEIVLSKENPFFQVGSIRLNDMPQASRGVYVELNYKTEVPFEVGLYFYDSSNRIDSDFQHGLNVKDEWNKVYLNFSPEFQTLGGLTDLSGYQIGIRAAMAVDEDGNFLEGTRSIFLDNLKLIYF